MEVIWTSSKKLRSYDLDLQRPDAFDLALHFVPGLKTRAGRAEPTPEGVPVLMMSPGQASSRQRGFRWLSEHQRSCRECRVLHDLAIDSANQANLLRIRQRAIMHNPRT